MTSLREAAKRYTCPRCGADPGDPCMGRRRARVSVHIERIEALQYAQTNGAGLGEGVERLRAMSYAEYLQTEHWLLVRRRALELAEGRCRMCGTDGRLQVHHRDYRNRGCERDSDVVALCGDCHDRHHATQVAAA